MAADAIRIEAGEPVRLRVLSYNIHHGEGLDRQLDLGRIAAIIRGAEPDLVALQECDRNTARSGGVDQPAELGRRTGMQVLFVRNIEYDGGEYGNAVLARWKPIEQAHHVLPKRSAGETRGVLDVQFDLDDAGPRVRFLATHLDHRSDDAERMASAKTIEKLVAERPDLPTVLAGDLNAEWKSPVIDVFRAQWQLANAEPVATYPAQDPKRQIDYILVRPRDRWRSLSFRVLEEPAASDHRPVVADLELLP